jgi:ubiquinone/menaquinone biosynthesis C-methylase UbiE
LKHSADDITQNDFEKNYIPLRQQEGRIYTDEQVASLPEITGTHPHYEEWEMRKESSRKLIAYLEKGNHSKDILEIGCGNGWLSHQLAGLPGSRVIGADINFTEVQQAARVFQDVPNLHFIYGHAESGLFGEKQFDSIIFAASIQYFASLHKTLKSTLRLLKSNGEIHIIDSHFYPLSELGAARQRSLLYYQAAGFPEMVELYFHHSIDDLDKYNYSILYDPNSLFNKFLRNKNPFYWIRIRQ